MIEILYILTVWNADTQVGDKPIFVDPRPLTFVECRLRRSNELALYEIVRNQKVYVLCTKETEL